MHAGRFFFVIAPEFDTSTAPEAQR